jgi:hypothetical protein
VNRSDLPAIASISTVDLDRMTDDGSPPAQAATSPVRHGKGVQVNGAPGPAIANTCTSMDDWYRQLGVSHRRRDEVAGHESRTLQDRKREQDTAGRRRWPGIVAAMRTLAGRYNEGARLDVLTVVDDAGGESRDPIVTIVAAGGQTLTVTLSGAELCVRPSPDIVGAPDDGRRWIPFGATDEATAAYALQDWLTHL